MSPSGMARVDLPLGSLCKPTVEIGILIAETKLTFREWRSPALITGRCCEPKRYDQGRPPAWLALQIHRRNGYDHRGPPFDADGAPS